MGPIGMKTMLNLCRLARIFSGSKSAAKTLLLPVMLAVLYGFGAPTAAAGLQVSEQQVKAAMIYRFLGYTEWPESDFGSPAAPYRVWVLGASEMANELRTITAARSVNDRPIEVFRTNLPERISSPHVIFVGQNAERYLPELRKLAHQRSILIITESETGLQAESIINLRLVEGRIGFDVSLANAKNNNLRLSARLLAVASSVEQESR